MLGDGADGFDGAGIERIGGIFRDEAAVGLHLGNAEQLGEIGNLAQGVDARGTGFGRNQADGGGPAQEVPFQRRRPTTSTVVATSEYLLSSSPNWSAICGVKPLI